MDVVDDTEQQQPKSVEKGGTCGTTMVGEGDEQEEEVPQFLKKLTEILGNPCFKDIVHWSLGELLLQ